MKIPWNFIFEWINMKAYLEVKVISSVVEQKWKMEEKE